MDAYVYKVSPPRTDMMFYPSTFWRSEDWESSTDRPREGYIEEKLFYAGNIDEISIHLFPRVRTARVRPADADSARLRQLGLKCSPGKSAYIFVEASRKKEVEAFCPTIYTFRSPGFTRVRRGEYVSREAQKAVSKETLPIAEALARWNIETCYVKRLDDVIDGLTEAGIYFEVQT